MENMERFPQNIYLTTIGDITFLVIENAHMWPINSIIHIDMQSDPNAVKIQFGGNQSWNFQGTNVAIVKALLSHNHKQEESLARRMEK
jgi:hypothetical protein